MDIGSSLVVPFGEKKRIPKIHDLFFLKLDNIGTKDYSDYHRWPPSTTMVDINVTIYMSGYVSG